MYHHSSMRSTFTEDSEKARHESYLRREAEAAKNKELNKFPVNHQAKARSPLCGPLYHPRLNRIAELRKNLNQIKNYEAKILATEKDLSQSTRENLNRAPAVSLTGSCEILLIFFWMFF